MAIQFEAPPNFDWNNNFKTVQAMTTNFSEFFLHFSGKKFKGIVT